MIKSPETLLLSRRPALFPCVYRLARNDAPKPSFDITGLPDRSFIQIWQSFAYTPVKM